eukprot:1158454-Pelagomonas_calceolata.AAC.19
MSEVVVKCQGLLPSDKGTRVAGGMHAQPVHCPHLNLESFGILEGVAKALCTSSCSSTPISTLAYCNTVLLSSASSRQGGLVQGWEVDLQLSSSMSNNSIHEWLRRGGGLKGWTSSFPDYWDYSCPTFCHTSSHSYGNIK